LTLSNAGQLTSVFTALNRPNPAIHTGAGSVKNAAGTHIISLISLMNTDFFFKVISENPCLSAGRCAICEHLISWLTGQGFYGISASRSYFCGRKKVPEVPKFKCSKG